MKKSLFLFGLISLMLIIGLAVIGCSGGSDPSNVVKQFHTAVEKGDNKAIAKLVTPESSGTVIGLLQLFQGTLMEYGSIESTQQTIDGDTAVVEVTYKNGNTDNYDLVKVDGKWLITINK